MIQSCKVMPYLGTTYTVDMKNRPQASPATMATVYTAAERRKMKKISTSSTTTTPYSVQHLSSRRRRRNSNSPHTTAANLQNYEECAEDCCSSGGGEVIGTSGCVSEDFTAIASSSSYCSSNCASFSSESDEAVEECTTSEIAADPEVERGETSTRLHEYCESPRDSDGFGQEFLTSKSIVQIKMPSASEIDDFFIVAEKSLQKRFLDKYNFDIVNDVPVSGRYEWVQIKP